MSTWRFNLGSYFRRNSVNIGVIIIICVLGTILFIEASAASKIQEQQRLDTKILSQVNTAISQISASGKQRTAQINDLQNHIDCIVDLFQQPNRASLTITDLEDCKLSANPTTSDNSNSNGSVGSTPPQTSNSGAKATQPTTRGGVSSTTQPTTPAVTSKDPPAPAKGLDALPVVGGLFKRLGL